MTDTNEIDSQNPLTMDLSKIDTSRPLMKSGIIVEFKIKTATLNTNDAKTLKLEYVAVSDVEGKEPGTTIPAERAMLFDNINTEPTGKLVNSPKPWEMIIQKCGQLIQAVDPKLTILDLRNNPQDLQGRIVRIRVGFEAAGTKNDGVWRGDQNRVAEYIKKAQ